MEQLIIQFSGWKGSGKDTLADYLVERLPSVKKYSYAGLLKTAFCEKFNIDFENLEIYKRDEKLFFVSIKDYYPELKNPNVRMGLIEYSCELKDKFGSDYFIEVVAQQIKENSDIRNNRHRLRQRVRGRRSELRARVSLAGYQRRPGRYCQSWRRWFQHLRPEVPSRLPQDPCVRQYQRRSRRTACRVRH